MTEQTIRRTYYPYWCAGNPKECRWADAAGPAGVLGTGTAEMQNFPNVGLFNLMWLMLDNPDYRNQRTSKEKQTLDFVIFQMQHEKAGKYTLSDVAALRTLPDFLQQVLQYRPLSCKALEAACLRKMGQLT